MNGNFLFSNWILLVYTKAIDSCYFHYTLENFLIISLIYQLLLLGSLGYNSLLAIFFIL